MTDTMLTPDPTDLKEAVAAQTAGLMKMLAVLATHGDMLKEILAAITGEPVDESPLVETLKQLVAATQANGDVLHRIEGAIAGRGAA
jgi:hypothetical protein